MNKFNRIFALCCLSAVVSIGKIDSRLTPYLESFKNAVIGLLLLTGGKGIKDLKSEVEGGNKFVDNFMKKLQSDSPNSSIADLNSKYQKNAKKIVSGLNTTGNILMGAGIFDITLGVLRIGEEIVDHVDKTIQKNSQKQVRLYQL